ncbi:MAG: TonB-dependent receptor plug domain-containing protein [Candidatus Latescibacteria bacterium]|nr:TonB-dependent receptor plug domain-containing protein [Candidatus Latescibacterota bacterium]NIM22642.1 TonB-dependent receptor plug domain-containing protein [Candidatus Latescibacterota bacterium]NIM64931.1 TonB-dependent receptor plug domain-containing protein [Candidatus Latescibacterota bacterium]NIO01446.1 TonB-dependent receptor plug domain-containing protein [Candidatus Latescibacterota bacterium]NIO27956.1 TonB-dependent receptor plug domain-containing protein [Candidatus Latesciba
MRLFHICLFLTLVLSLPCTAFPDDGTPHDRDVLTAKEIQRAGLTRLGDILLLADKWNICTIDGFSWQASPNGLSSFRGQTWVVMVDGQRMNPNLYDSNNLNLLPIVLDEVDSVEIVSSPRIHHGEFTERGLIHIYTRKPAPGVSFRGSVMGGNETGDPGPYRYTEYSSPNVDFIGPDATLTMGYGSRNWYVQGNVATQVHFFRDPAMVARNSRILKAPDSRALFDRSVSTTRYETLSFLGRLGFDDVWPGMRRVASSFKAGITTSRGKHEPFVGYSFARRYFLFFKPFGREIPVDHRLAHIGQSGTVLLGGDAALTYRLTYSDNQLDKYPNALDVDFDWRIKLFSANIESDFKLKAHRSTAGIEFKRFSLDTSYPLADDAFDILKAYGSLSHSPFESVRQTYGVLAASTDDGTAVKTFASNNWNMNKRNVLTTHLSFSQRLFEEDNSIWFWTARGYDLLNDQGVVYSIAGEFDKSEQFTVDITWKSHLTSDIQIETGPLYRRFEDTYVEQQSFQFDPQECSFDSPVQILPVKEGQLFGANLSIQHHLSPRLFHQLRYGYRHAFSGDEVFKGIWHSIPKHKATYRFAYAPDRNFRIWGALSYTSSSKWEEYRNIDGQSCALAGEAVTYSSTVKSSTILDLQIQKWFWKRKLRGDFLCRNAWNEEFRYHPIGATFDLSFYFQLKILVDSR